MVSNFFFPKKNILYALLVITIQVFGHTLTEFPKSVLVTLPQVRIFSSECSVSWSCFKCPYFGWFRFPRKEINKSRRVVSSRIGKQMYVQLDQITSSVRVIITIFIQWGIVVIRCANIRTTSFPTIISSTVILKDVKQRIFFKQVNSGKKNWF